MPNYNAKEQLRRVYQQTDECEKTFIPAKPKVDTCPGGPKSR